MREAESFCPLRWKILLHRAPSEQNNKDDYVVLKRSPCLAFRTIVYDAIINPNKEQTYIGICKVYR